MHLGNAVNFVVIDNYAEQHGLELILRIDDIDVVRARPEYRSDIDRVLQWLEISPSLRTSNASSSVYRDALHQLPVFHCRCSRTSTQCACAHRDFPLVPGESVAKLHDSSIVLWRRDDLPAYHLVNVVDDARLGITDVVRGEDLRESSFIHSQIARLLGFTPPKYLHHPLITDAAGAKLSKSTLRSGTAMSSDAATLEWVRERAREMPLT